VSRFMAHLEGTLQTGKLAHDNGRFGFIKMDVPDVEDMFVMPIACRAWGGQLPAIGTKLQFHVVLDVKTGRPRAGNVEPREGGLTAETLDRVKENLLRSEKECIEVIKRADRQASPSSRYKPSAGQTHATMVDGADNAAGQRLPQETQDDVALKLCAANAAQDMFSTLKDLHPQISKEEVTAYVHDIVHSDVHLAHNHRKFRSALRETVPSNRQDWHADSIEDHITALKSIIDPSTVQKAKNQAIALLTHPRTHSVAAGGGGGAVVFGITGGALGCTVGVVGGGAIGVVPAIFTFGLSIPVGAVIGGGVGFVAGTAVGGGAGGLAGGLGGHVGYMYRVEIKNGIVHIKQQAIDMSNSTKTKASAIADRARTQVFATCESAKQAAGKHTQRAKGLVKDTHFQVTAASAAGGAAVGGAGGGVIGLGAGGTIGAIIGLVPALFTFGLSIPIGAALGGGAGLCVGSTAGGSVGATVCGTTGYHGYKHRAALQRHATTAYTKTRAKLVGAEGTGGTQ